MILEFLTSAVLSGATEAISSLTAKLFDKWLSKEIPERTEILRTNDPDESILLTLKDEVGTFFEKNGAEFKNFINYLSVRLKQSFEYDEEPAERSSAILIILHIGILYPKQFDLTPQEKNILIGYQDDIVEALSEYMNAVGNKFADAKRNIRTTSLGIIANEKFGKVLGKLKEEMKLPRGGS